MPLQDTIYAYFERDPRLRVLFVFDNDTSYSLTTELENVKCRDYQLRFYAFADRQTALEYGVVKNHTTFGSVLAKLK